MKLHRPIAPPPRAPVFISFSTAYEGLKLEIRRWHLLFSVSRDQLRGFRMKADLTAGPLEWLLLTSFYTGSRFRF